MSNSESDDKGNTEPSITVQNKPLKLTPPGYEVVLSEEETQRIAEFVSAPVYKILKNRFVAQRKDHIARLALNNAGGTKQIEYFQGMAAELTLFFKTMERVQREHQRRAKQDMDQEQ